MKTKLQWFLSGVSSVAVAMPAFGHFGGRPEHQSDFDALRGDWEMIGSDMRAAFNDEQKKQASRESDAGAESTES
ncbi:MAG: hypothetical protein ABF296_07540 [Oceanococcaceae bacterium]